MRKMILTAMVLMAIQGIAMAQGSTDRKGWGYVVGGAGAATGGFTNNIFSVGAGGERLVGNGLGLGAEIGYVSLDRGNGFGLFSAGPSYHFNRSSKLVPFVSGGYSAAIRGGASPGGHFGGGVQYWMKEHVGLRFEFRDHVFSSDSPHMFQFRVGVSFR